jgi:hypothetical protein
MGLRGFSPRELQGAGVFMSLVSTSVRLCVLRASVVLPRIVAQSPSSSRATMPFWISLVPS